MRREKRPDSVNLAASIDRVYRAVLSFIDRRGWGGALYEVNAPNRAFFVDVGLSGVRDLPIVGRVKRPTPTTSDVFVEGEIHDLFLRMRGLRPILV